MKHDNSDYISKLKNLAKRAAFNRTKNQDENLSKIFEKIMTDIQARAGKGYRYGSLWIDLSHLPMMSQQKIRDAINDEFNGYISEIKFRETDGLLNCLVRYEY